MRLRKNKDFKVEEEKGVYSIHWAKGDIDALIIPMTVFQSSQMGIGAGAGAAGMNVDAKQAKEWRGESVAFVTHSGQTATLDAWKNQLEQGLKASGIATKISVVYDAQSVFASGQVSAVASSIPYAKTESWKCTDCGKVIEANHPHVH